LFLRMMSELWQSAEDQPRFLCPVPGYDRHFAICEEFGIDMVTVPMTDTGPDMDVVERLVREDASIKGIWCVPRYSKPTGCTYSDEVVDRMSRLPQHAGDDFVIMWDNAYIAHHLAETPDPLKSIMACCREINTTKNLVILASTSKITFAGAGISFLATAREQLAQFEKYLGIAMIGFDKVNQLRHLRFLEDQAGLAAHMEKHRKILAPKFKSVLSILETELGGTGIARWTKPNGGYFVSLDTMPGLASNVIGMAADAGVKLTPAGATFPYGRDPENSNIRIAPTYPPVEQLNKAMSVLVLCIQLCSAAQLIRA
ncbi:MAG: aminotransferase class I/II-fold pyridoxal phosphate-dependent enzyme, partial [Pseudomonadales bacterium]|nr:aminotransferase class I/II-fold pyridoxal phosphate-dependent enzyme [Pseudomonadales bacterium]